MSASLQSSAPVRPSALLVASGDSRRSANVACWPAQEAMEREAARAFDSIGWNLVRAHPERASDAEPHGFVHSQRHGREVFAGIDRDKPLVVAEAVWQYSMHVLPGLLRHRGPVLILANWSGQWPGLVGALNLRGSLTKAGRSHSMLWGEDFSDAAFRRQLREWCDRGEIAHDRSHVVPFEPGTVGGRAARIAEDVAADLKERHAILGVFDEGCMGMFNAIIPDAMLHRCGVFKERLSQSALVRAMADVPDDEAQAVRAWYAQHGMRFETGTDEAEHLTERQILEQCRMYVAAARLADEFGCDAVGIQYQLGLADVTAASDLAEGTLNCSIRPPVARADGSIIRDGEPITHFNEVDECAGLDGLLTQRVWQRMGMMPDNTLHDVRWGDADRSGSRAEFVWVFEISGSVPPTHFAGGWRDAVGMRQPPMYFRLGGSTIRGVSRPGECVWSRIFVTPEGLEMDIGRCAAVELPSHETERRWAATTRQWPIMHAVTYGVSRDQLMARHQANHIQLVYASNAPTADRALAAKAAAAHVLGIRVHLCGTNREGRPLAEVVAQN